MKRHALSLLLVIAFSIVQAIARPVDITIVYDNQVTSVNNGRVNDPDFPLFLMHADSFSLSSSAVVNQVNWMGAYKGDNLLPTGDDNFIVRFFEFSGGIPQTIPFATFSIGAAERQSAFQSLPPSGNPVFAYSASLPNTELGAGSYLISIMNDKLDDNPWMWADREGVIPGHSFLMVGEGTPWLSASGGGVAEFAFSISRVPEPKEAMLLCCGLLMLGILFRESSRVARKAGSMTRDPLSRV